MHFTDLPLDDCVFPFIDTPQAMAALAATSKSAHAISRNDGAIAWRGMVQHVVDPRSGFLGFCQPVGGGPAPATASDTSDFCVGLFLLAASEVAKLAPQ